MGGLSASVRQAVLIGERAVGRLKIMPLLWLSYHARNGIERRGGRPYADKFRLTHLVRQVRSVQWLSTLQTLERSCEESDNRFVLARGQLAVVGKCCLCWRAQ